MTRHDDIVRLRHMLDHAQEARAMASGCTRQTLSQDRKLELALVRLIEVVGKAASRVSAGTREKHPEVPWRETSSMRNRLIHGYDEVDLDVLWNTVQHDLPSLIAVLENVIRDEGSSATAS